MLALCGPAAAEEKADVRKLLEPQLLGTWVQVGTLAKPPTAKAGQEAQLRCRPRTALGGLRFERGLPKTLPNRTDIAGDVHWAAFKEGLTRFDWAGGTVTRYPEAKTAMVKGRRVFSLRGRTGVRNMLFQKIETRLGKADMMVADRAIFLRCVGSAPAAEKDGG